MACNKLKDKHYFKNYRIDPFTIDWNNVIAFAPEFLYEHGNLSDKKAYVVTASTKSLCKLHILYR